jgi:hypothetical protein
VDNLLIDDAFKFVLVESGDESFTVPNFNPGDKRVFSGLLDFANLCASASNGMRARIAVLVNGTNPLYWWSVNHRVFLSVGYISP